MPISIAVGAQGQPARVRAERMISASATAFAGALAVAAVAPFETLDPLVRLPWQSVSNVELTIVAAGGAWAASLLAGGSRAWWRTPLTWPWLVVVAVMLASAITAPAFRTNALHMAGRFAVAGGVFLMTVAGSASPSRARLVLATTVRVAVAVAVIAILEFLSFAPVLTLLRIFRADLSFVGEQVRASGTLQYPTIASMYLEIAFAYALGLFVQAADEDARVAAVGWLMALLAIAEAIVVTFTRAGLIAMALALLLTGLIGWRRSVRGRTIAAVLALVAAAILVETIASHSGDATRRRLTTEAQDAWYRAAFDAPAVVHVGTDATVIVPVTVTNTGRSAWSSDARPPFNASYHWVTEDGERVVAYEGYRTPFPGAVAPGATVVLAMRVRAPQRPGRYRLLWDIAQEGRLWFSTETNAELSWSAAVVEGSPVAGATVLPERPLPRGVTRPGRLVLWTAAARMLFAHPLLGVGPDNYRLTYGDYVGVRRADPRVHTNNMYLEMAVGAGLAGAAAFGWLIWSAIGSFRRALACEPRLTAIVGVAAAGAAILVHGFVDSFLGFTATYVAIAVTLGVAVAAGSASTGEWDADRV